MHKLSLQSCISSTLMYVYALPVLVLVSHALCWLSRLMSFWCTTRKYHLFFSFRLATLCWALSRPAVNLFFQSHHWHAWSQSSRAVALFSLNVFHCVASLPSVSSLASPIFTFLFYSVTLILLTSFHSLFSLCLGSSFFPTTAAHSHPSNVTHSWVQCACMYGQWLHAFSMTVYKHNMMTEMASNLLFEFCSSSAQLFGLDKQFSINHILEPNSIQS